MRDGIPPEKRAAHRKGLCRWCLGPVLPPKRTFCSPACVHEWKLRTMQSYVRRLVKNRDGGICAQCGYDCDALARDLGIAAYRWTPGEFLDRIVELKLQKRLHAYSFRLWVVFARVGKTPSIDQQPIFRSLWDADHVTSIEEGGSFDLSNLQTLCWRCHAAKTKEHAARRAARRRAAKSGSR